MATVRDDRLEVLVDVDGTMLLYDAAGEKLNEELRLYLSKLDKNYYKLICWSGGGKEYARHRLEDKYALYGLFEEYRDKPAMIFDDNLHESIWVRHPKDI